MKKLRLTCPGLMGHKWYRQDPSPAMPDPEVLLFPSDLIHKQQKEDAET